MAAVTKQDPDQEVDDDRDDREESSTGKSSPKRDSSGQGGFFTIYKKGQGYWTRMGTAGGAALIGALVIYNLFQYLPAFEMTKWTIIVVSVIFAVVYALGVYWLMNKPGNAEFLIATDSEMKKVNWTSRKELIGSTRVVVVFMFFIATLLFVIDMLYRIVFYYMHVLKVPPPFFNG
jgi:preprotein translocase subunit SecE